MEPRPSNTVDLPMPKYEDNRKVPYLRIPPWIPKVQLSRVGRKVAGIRPGNGWVFRGIGLGGYPELELSSNVDILGVFVFVVLDTGRFCPTLGSTLAHRSSRFASIRK